MDKIRNEYIRGPAAQVGRFGEKTREARLRWYGHVLRKYDGYIGRRILRMKSVESPTWSREVTYDEMSGPVPNELSRMDHGC